MFGPPVMTEHNQVEKQQGGNVAEAPPAQQWQQGAAVCPLLLVLTAPTWRAMRCVVLLDSCSRHEWPYSCAQPSHRHTPSAEMCLAGLQWHW
jgi:hypothetical protein